MIRLTEAEVSERITEYEVKWPDFATVYETPTCCPGCMIPYDRWGFEQVNDWTDYYNLRWLRGGEIEWRDEDE